MCEQVLGVHDAALDFCRTVLDEVMDLFPSPYVHIGGDECPVVEWETSPVALRRAAEEGLPAAKALHGWFFGRLGDHLLAAGRRPLCWAEDSGAPPAGFAVMPWRDADHGLTAARRGHDVVMSPHRSTYFDNPQSDDPGEPLGQAGDAVDLRAVHGAGTAPGSWEPQAAARVLGTQGHLWTEFVTSAAQAEYLLFPRLCAIADRVLNPGSRWAEDLLPALDAHRARLAALGVRHGAIPPPPGRTPPAA